MKVQAKELKTGDKISLPGWPGAARIKVKRRHPHVVVIIPRQAITITPGTEVEIVDPMRG